MKRKTLVITGDNLGLANTQIHYPDLEVVQFPVHVAGEEFRDSESTNAYWLIEKFQKEKMVAKSVSIVQGDLLEIVERNKDKYDLIVHVLMSRVLSQATFSVAEEVRNTHSLYVIPDLGYLHRGGRIGAAKALMGSVLKIIPLVGIVGSNPETGVVPLGKARTYSQVNALIIDFILARMKDKGSGQVKMMAIVDLNAERAAVDDLMHKIDNSIACEKVVKGTPRLVEAVHGSPGAEILRHRLQSGVTRNTL